MHTGLCPGNSRRCKSAVRALRVTPGDEELTQRLTPWFCFQTKEGFFVPPPLCFLSCLLRGGQKVFPPPPPLPAQERRGTGAGRGPRAPSPTLDAALSGWTGMGTWAGRERGLSI